MERIKTKNFELAVLKKGDESASRLALVVPGRLDTKDYVHNISLVDFLAERGYLAVSFDPPGTWESGGGIELYKTSNVIQCVDELVEYFGNKPTILAGHSRGGTIATLAGPKNKCVTHLIAIFSHYGPPSEPKKEKVVNNTVAESRDIPPGTQATQEKKRFDLPLNYFYEPLEYSGIENCTKPKLFLYGEHDTVVDFEDVQEMHKQAAEPKELVGINSDHDYRYSTDAIQKVNEAVGKFLNKYKI